MLLTDWNSLRQHANTLKLRARWAARLGLEQSQRLITIGEHKEKNMCLTAMSTALRLFEWC